MTSVTVQSNKALGRVDKISYSLQGRYHITKIYPCGSYKLFLLLGSSQPIKKHGSVIYLKDIVLYRKLPTSDNTYSILNKKTEICTILGNWC